MRLDPPPTILETPRISMRRLVPDDLDSLFALYRDPEVRRFFPEGVLTREQTSEELEWHRHGYPRYPELGLWATIDRATGRFIGRCGLLPWTIEGRHEVEVAYLIAPEFQGRGLGTEAARGIVEHAFGALGLSRLVCLIDPGNRPSIKVATNIGMTLEGDAEDELGRFCVYARNA
jgi:RimJ/RimL family protein N-acetyltransferase